MQTENTWAPGVNEGVRERNLKSQDSKTKFSLSQRGSMWGTILSKGWFKSVKVSPSLEFNWEMQWLEAGSVLMPIWQRKPTCRPKDISCQLVHSPSLCQCISLILRKGTVVFQASSVNLVICPSGDVCHPGGKDQTWHNVPAFYALTCWAITHRVPHSSSQHILHMTRNTSSCQ